MTNVLTPAPTGQTKTVRIQARLKNQYDFVLSSSTTSREIVRPAKGYIEIEHRCGTCPDGSTLTILASVDKGSIKCAVPAQSLSHQCVVSGDKVCISFYNIPGREVQAVRFIYKMPVPPFGVSLATEQKCKERTQDDGDVCKFVADGGTQCSTAANDVQSCTKILTGSIKLEYFTVRFFDDCNEVANSDPDSDICANCFEPPPPTTPTPATPSPNRPNDGLMGLKGQPCKI